jgi:hypothetical protein
MRRRKTALDLSELHIVEGKLIREAPKCAIFAKPIMAVLPVGPSQLLLGFLDGVSRDEGVPKDLREAVGTMLNLMEREMDYGFASDPFKKPQ